MKTFLFPCVIQACLRGFFYISGVLGCILGICVCLYGIIVKILLKDFQKNKTIKAFFNIFLPCALVGDFY